MFWKIVSFGQHLGYWKNGNRKFDFKYFNDKREGLQKQWYESGSKYYELSFTDDQEKGTQKAWRENGKPYINYEVKDGVRYGLQKSALCYTLKDEKLKWNIAIWYFAYLQLYLVITIKNDFLITTQPILHQNGKCLTKKHFTKSDPLNS